MLRVLAELLVTVVGLGGGRGSGGARRRAAGCSVRCREGAETGKGEGVGERDRSGAWRRPDASGKRQAGREELASSAARVRACSCSYWQEEGDRRRQVGWASWAVTGEAR